MMRRARPLLGTLVAVSSNGPAEAVERAFTAIEQVHRLMSAQLDDSDIGRINRQALRAPVQVHPWTFEVLERAVDFSARSGGAFDVAATGDYTALELAAGTVSLRRPARIDVSGIAKGFAVDVAVTVMQSSGATAGNVNAGGDLRFFGDWPRPIRVRVPGAPHNSVPLPPSCHSAFATSCGDFGSAIRDPRTDASLSLDWSVTVAAASCLVADALTKVVALLGPKSAVLDAFDAVAYAVDRDGCLHAAAR